MGHLIPLDLRYALRVLARRPLFALTSVLTLALGIGAATAIFTVVYAVLIQPLPYRDPTRLVALWESNFAAGIPKENTSDANFNDWKRESRSLEDVTAYAGWFPTLAGADEPEQLTGAVVAPNFSTCSACRRSSAVHFSPEKAIRGRSC